MITATTVSARRLSLDETSARLELRLSENNLTVASKFARGNQKVLARALFTAHLSELVLGESKSCTDNEVSENS